MITPGSRASGSQVDPDGLNDANDIHGLVQVSLSSSEIPRSIRNLGSIEVSRLVVVTGIVIAATRTACKATMMRLKCRSCGDKVTIHTNQGLGGFALPRTCAKERMEGDEQCPLDPYVVLPDESRYVDIQTLKLQEVPESVPTGEMPRSISLTVERALTNRISPGVRIMIIGEYSVRAGGSAAGVGGAKRAPLSGSSLQVTVRAPYIRGLGMAVDELAAYSGSRSSHVFGFEEEESMMSISRLPRLYEIVSRSIAPEIYGHEDIKRAVAAQLFAGALDKKLPDATHLRGDINILLLGDPSTAKSQMLKYAERVAPVSVYTSGKGSSAAGLTASVIKSAATNEFHLEGGAMVLADGGIVCIDEFDKMRLQDRVAIHEAMEQQTISIAKAGITAVLNARAAVLAAANPAFGRYDDTRTSQDNIEFQSTILSRFDLIFIIRDVRDDRRDRTIANHVLSLHQRGNEPKTASKGIASASDAPLLTGPPSAPHLDINTLKRYIAYCRNRCSPRLTQEAAELLRNNYVSIRDQVRQKSLNDPDSQQSVPITVRQLEAIVRISEALAKMEMREEVSTNDVTEAIRLFKVATLDSTRSQGFSMEIGEEGKRVESAVKRRLPRGSMASERRLIDHFLDEGYSESVVRRALAVMVRRGELAYRRQRRYVFRAL